MAKNKNNVDVDLGINDDAITQASINEVSDDVIKSMEKEELEVLDKRVDVFPWDLALETYDSAFPNYVPSTDALDFFNLMRLVQGGDFPVPNSVGQYFMIDLAFGNVTQEMYPYSKEVNEQILIDQERIAMCCSRGVSKSTLITCFLPVYVAIKGELPNKGKQYFWALLGASSRGHGRVMAKGIAGFCEESKFMKNMMEDMHFTETEATFVRMGNQHIKERTFTIKFGSAYSPIRGVKDAYGHRLCGALLDDVIPTSSAAYSPVVMDTLETALYADIANALKASGGIIINVFTPFWVGDPCTKSIINKAFTPLLLPLAEKLDDQDITKEDIVSSWSQMHSVGSIYKMWNTAKKAGMMKLFQQERQLQLVSGQDRLVPDECLQYFDVDNVIRNIHAYNIYITSDFTTTSGENSDFSGIACWAYSNNGDWFMLELALRKMNMAEQYDTMLDWADKYTRMGKYVELGVELDGGQATHVFSLEERMAKRAQYYSFAKQRNADRSVDRKGIISKNGGGNKIERFRIAVSNYMLPKKLWLPRHLKHTPDMQEMLRQIKGATHKAFTRSDDGPDLISMLFQLVVIKPTQAGYSTGHKAYADSVYDGYSYDSVEDEYDSVVF